LKMDTNSGFGRGTRSRGIGVDENGLTRFLSFLRPSGGVQESSTRRLRLQFEVAWCTEPFTV